MEEARLARERQELLKLQAEVMARIDDLKKVQAVLEELVKTDQEQREGRVQQLVKMLSKMKPDAAGAVVAKLDDQMAVDVFIKMSPRTSEDFGHLEARPRRAHRRASYPHPAIPRGRQAHRPGRRRRHPAPGRQGRPAPPPAEGPGKR